MRKKPHENLENRIIVSENILFDKNNKIIYLSKPKLTPEDTIALNFAKTLEEHKIKYVIVAGYIAILFGRARRSDDIDFIADIDENTFSKLCETLFKREFTLMQKIAPSKYSIRKIFKDYLTQGYNIRYMYKNIIIPNIEFKLATTSIHQYAITNSYKVTINNQHTIRISPLELQIAYKLSLNSDKDIGDAVFLYTLFKNIINHEELNTWCNKLETNCKTLYR